MKINAERLAARVHDALTRDYNENHDEHGRFASDSGGAMAASKAALDASRDKNAKYGRANTVDLAKTAASYVGKGKTDEDRSDRHLEVAGMHDKIAAEHLKLASGIQGDGYYRNVDAVKAHITAALAHLNAASANRKAGASYVDPE